ncbi:hypothetical protein HAZT_HAZT012086 [Hyalella azteca]|nr:hypothetical protein HAZT_HAZT012086 [Hyalella azteca]
MYVGNLHDDVTDSLLYELFLQAGPLQSINRVKDRETGRLKNFAFVIFTHAVSVPYAIHLTNGIKLLGRPLKTQRRNNVDLPHYLSVGVHCIENESDIQRTLNGDENPRAEDYSKGRDSSYVRKSRHDGSFKPKPLDPNQTWKNTIDYNLQQQQAQQQTNHYMNNASLTGNASHLLPDRQQRNVNSRPSSQSFSGGSPARSASHYHQMNDNILGQMSGSGDLRNKLGGNNYRSTRDDRGAAYSNQSAGGYAGGYNGPNRSSSLYHTHYGSTSFVNTYSAQDNSRKGYSGSDYNSGYGSGRYYDSYDRNNGNRNTNEGMQHRLGRSPNEAHHRSRSYDSKDYNSWNRRT